MNQNQVIDKTACFVIKSRKNMESIPERIARIRNELNEVEKLIKKYGPTQQAFDAIGYREIIEYLMEKITLQKAVENMKNNTWHYAKRQLTWFRPDKKIHWVKNYKEAEKLIKKFL